jgi:hypothetical protein
MAEGRISSLAKKAVSQNALERDRAIFETQSTIVLYAMLIYHFYPIIPEMRQRINTTPELHRNFMSMKQWLDSNGGPKIVDDFYRDISSRVSGANIG